MMYKLTLLVRELRQKKVFKVNIRLILVLLLILGLWVATMPLSSSSLPKINDKLVHLIVFFGFALLTDLATAREPFWFWKGLPLLVYGAVVEISQYFTAYRSFELVDWLADGAGVLLYYVLKYVMRWGTSKRVEAQSE